MRQRPLSRWIPVAYCVAPHQFRLSDELRAVAGPFWSDLDRLMRFVAQVAGQSPDAWESVFTARTEGDDLLLTVANTGDDWRRSLLEAMLWTIRIPAVLVEQAKWADLLQQYDCRKTAQALLRPISQTPGPPAALTDMVQSCASLPPSAAAWTSLERAVRHLVAGGWLSADAVHAALKASQREC